MVDEKTRVYGQLASLRGAQPMPSIGDWILVRVARPREVARAVNHRVAPGIASVPPHIDGCIRLTVSDPMTNERVIRVLREVVH